ncbi:hypothetical protein A4E84_16885 [Streptomyces qaidamensis]|uniref:rRNA N-glycosylase n=1 Tax=Streptomyces qaidamensis TaxID=1783515 RepID=A0A143C0L8_9ACTN|nr:ribosome-inactivating family protein [Streptomyces qaidamensis]AMW11036.1 hypothetical protein A4E84_16885 [Streptomyces qaidamensis]
MPRFQVLRRLRTSAVVPAALVGALAVTSVSGLTETHHTSLGQETQLVSATTPTDGISIELDTGVHRDFAHRYDALINDIRGRVRGTRLYGNIILAPKKDDYFGVTLAVGNGRQITLVFNAKNLYIVGWRNHQTNTYYRLGHGPETLPGASAVRNLNWINYNSMESAAEVGRGSLGISMGTIQGSISDLGNPHYAAAGRDQARALLILTQAFAEGARTDFISYRVSQAIRGGHSYYSGESSSISSNGSNSGGSMIDVTGLDFERDWSDLSLAVERATHNHAAPRFRIGDGYLTTLSAIDAQLAVALYHTL